MQQHLMAAYHQTNITTDHIQQFLDENKSLILKIVESQNSGRISECAEHRARLQQNLMYLAAIADSQPQPQSMHSAFATGGMMQSGAHYMQPEQAHQLTQQTLMAARSSMLYNQQAYSLQQQQALHGQLGMNSAGSSLNILQSEDHDGGGAALGSRGFPDFYGRGTSREGLDFSGTKQETDGSNSGAYDGQTRYSKAGDDGN